MTGSAVGRRARVGSWPGGALTAFEWLLVVKGVMCFLAPDVALRSMARTTPRAGFVAAGVMLPVVGAWEVIASGGAADRPDRVVARIERHVGESFARVRIRGLDPGPPRSA